MERPEPDIPLEALTAGATRFDRGQWWEAHEAWEHGWKAFPAPHRHYLKGLIQLAAVNWHLERGHRPAARRLVDTAAGHLAACRPLAWPIDTGMLLTALAALAVRLDRSLPVVPLRLRLLPMLAAG